MVAYDLARDALQVAGDAIVTVDADGRITSWNRRAEQLFGHPAEQVVGQTLAFIIPERYRPRHIAGFHAALTGDALSHGGQAARVRAQTRAGAEITLLMSLGLLPRRGGQAGGVVALLREAGREPVPFVEESDRADPG